MSETTDATDVTDHAELSADRSETTASSTLLNGLLGGLAAVVFSMLPFSTVLGGALAGYLERGHYSTGARVGAVAGVVVLVPYLAGAGAVVATGVELPMATAPFLGLVAVGGLLYVVGASTLGGVLGAHVRAAR